MTAPVFDLPDIGFDQVSFDLIVPRDGNRMEGRRTETRLYGTPYWSAQYQFSYQDERGVGIAEAFMRKLTSRSGVFRAYDAFRPRPIEFATTPIAWTPNIVSIIDPNTVIVEGVPNNAQFRAGDYVGFIMSSLVVSLHSIASDALANGSGAVTLSIDAALDTQNFTTAAMPLFEKPYCLMQPANWSGPKSWQSRQPSFTAEEIFFYDMGGEEY